VTGHPVYNIIDGPAAAQSVSIIAGAINKAQASSISELH